MDSESPLVCQDLVAVKAAHMPPEEAGLYKAVLLQNYLEAYGDCVYCIAPVWIQVLDRNCTRELFSLEDSCHSESDDTLLFNFYVALALGKR